MADDKKDTAAAEPAGFDALGAVEELAAAMDGVEIPHVPPETEEGRIAELEQEIADLGELLQKADAEANAARLRADAAEAEIERAKERLARESERVLEGKVRKVLLSFLEVMDDLERAMESARQMDHNPAVLAGVELVRKSLLTELAKCAVQPMDSQGAPFDPNVHDAMTTVAVTDDAQHGTVVGVIRPGYTLGDGVLRPAGVAVGKKG